MTCIIGLEKNGVVYLGGDSQITASHTKQTRRDPKLFANGPFLIGTSGSIRYNQILRYKFTPPAHHPAEKPDFEFMVVDVVDAVMQCMEEAGFLRLKDGVKDTASDENYGYALFAYHGNLYYFGADFQMGNCEDGYDAIGSGHQVALGAMYALINSGMKLTPEDCILKSLEAAAHINTTVGPPYVILKLEK